MTGEGGGTLDVGHPAPQRHAVNPVLLLFALLGGPIGWMSQLLFAFASTSFVCDRSLSIGVPGWLGPVIIVLNLCGLAVAVTALAVALRLHGRTAHEHRQRSGGVVEVGEGRTRFLAVWGMVISGVFIVATLANTFSLLLVPLCRT